MIGGVILRVSMVALLSSAVGANQIMLVSYERSKKLAASMV
jgi:hypothetical protein